MWTTLFDLPCFLLNVDVNLDLACFWFKEFFSLYLVIECWCFCSFFPWLSIDIQVPRFLPCLPLLFFSIDLNLYYIISCIFVTETFLILSCGLLFGLIGHFGLLKDIKIFLSLSLPISTCIFQSDIAILLQREILHMEHSKVLKPYFLRYSFFSCIQVQSETSIFYAIWFFFCFYFITWHVYQVQGV